MWRPVTVARGMLTADDLIVGHVFQLGEHTPPRNEIVEYATAWDPQPFHTDLEAARTGYFGDVIASGVHTLGIFQRLAVESVYSRLDVLAGRSLQSVQFLKPVLQARTLTGSVTVAEVDLSSEIRAPVLLHGALCDLEGIEVFTVEVDVIIWRRCGREGMRS